MQNFINTEWEQLTEEEIFNENQKLVFTTIQRQFPNQKQFCKVHMIDLDDLKQMGNMGLLNAIRNFNNDEKVKFQTHAINNIIWEINTQARLQSLRNENTRTFDLVDCVSTEEKLHNGSDSESLTVMDTIFLPKEEETEYVAEESILEKEVIEFLRQDKDIDKLTFFILVSRIKGVPMDEIADQLGIHRNSAYERLWTQRVKRVKARLEKYLRDGEV